MIVEVKVPLLSESVSEGTLMSWHKKVGDAVARDEILIDVETDKVVLEVPSPQAGVLVEIIAQDGETVVAEQLLAKIDTAAQAQAAAVLAAEQAEQQAAADRSATEAAAAQAAPPDAAPQEPPLLAEPAPSTNLPPASAATATCPQCQHTVGHDDMFCGECGHRLKS